MIVSIERWAEVLERAVRRLDDLAVGSSQLTFDIIEDADAVLAEMRAVTVSENVGWPTTDTCRKCGSHTKAGLCSDVTCPFSDRQQHETYTEG